MNKIRKGDEIIVLTGKDKKRRGRVALIVDSEHVIVEGINRVKKHTKPNPMKGEVGGIVEKEMPIHISNVAIFNANTQKADRVGIKVEEVKLENGKTKQKRVRVFKSSGALVDA